MQKLYKILWSLALLLITVTILIVSFWLILGVLAVLSIVGIYRYYFMKRKSRKFNMNPYTHVEVIDLKAEEIHEMNLPRKPDEFN